MYVVVIIIIIIIVLVAVVVVVYLFIECLISQTKAVSFRLKRHLFISRHKNPVDKFLHHPSNNNYSLYTTEETGVPGENHRRSVLLTGVSFKKERCRSRDTNLRHPILTVLMIQAV